jgi:hypothetical protein
MYGHYNGFAIYTPSTMCRWEENSTGSRYASIIINNLLITWATVNPTEGSTPWTLWLCAVFTKGTLNGFGLRSITMSHPEYRDLLNYGEVLRYLIIDSTRSRDLTVSSHSPRDLTGVHNYTKLNCNKCQSDSICEPQTVTSSPRSERFHPLKFMNSRVIRQPTCW